MKALPLKSLKNIGTRTLPFVMLISILIAVHLFATSDKSQPEELFSQVFYPVEKTLGIKIRHSKFKIRLLSKLVILPSLSVSSRAADEIASVSNIAFPPGLIFGGIPPEKARLKVGSARLKVDFTGKPFWCVKTDSGVPLPGSPDIYAGELNAESSDITIKLKSGNMIKIHGGSFVLRNIYIPATSWSQCVAPEKKWAEIEVNDSSISLSGMPANCKLLRLFGYFKSNTLIIKEASVECKNPKKINVSGDVIFKRGQIGGFALDITVKGLEIAIGKYEIPIKEGSLTLHSKVKPSGEVTSFLSGKFLTESKLLPKVRVRVKIPHCSLRVRAKILIVTKNESDGIRFVKGELCNLQFN